MKAIKIILLSSSENLRDFFRLEALNFGFLVDCFDKFEKIHNDISDYDLAIIDIDTIKRTPLNTAKREITVSSQKGKADLTYPISISALRNIYNRLFVWEDCAQEKIKEDALKVVFLKKQKNTVSIKKKKYLLSDAEYNLLSLLCKNSQNIVLREDIDKLFGGENSNIADVYICKLRKKLEEPLGQRLIITVRSKGYKIIAEAEWR